MSVASRESFYGSLVRRPGTLVARYAFPSMPNTNKAMLELMCGIQPLAETNWCVPPLGRSRGRGRHRHRHRRRR